MHLVYDLVYARGSQKWSLHFLQLDYVCLTLESTIVEVQPELEHPSVQYMVEAARG